MATSLRHGRELAQQYHARRLDGRVLGLRLSERAAATGNEDLQGPAVAVAKKKGVKNMKSKTSDIFQRNWASGVSKTDAAYRRELRGRIIVPIR